VPRRNDVLRWAAPAAFLAALTIAVLLIRAGLNGQATTTVATTPTAPATTRTQISTTKTRPGGAKTTPAGAAGFYTVQSGDTFGSIAGKNGTSVSQLEQLNPGVSSNSLSVGQRIRVK
jgi:LysM repeat protein